MTIGNNVGVSGMCAVAQNSITIENDVMIGSGCCIYDTDFHSLQFEHRMNKPDMHIKTKPVKICKGAFIGARSIILKGVTIGENSVIGAGSIVTKNVPENEIWAGNPARFIKKI
ncbi:MAG: acyltransferase [Clostridia bacterium]|nr:acyltransferase [Clostridia bacterium]